MTSAAMVADLTELAGVDMTAYSKALIFVEAYHCWFRYDGAYAGADSLPYTKTATTGGGGWHATGAMWVPSGSENLNPGAANSPIQMYVTQSGSGGTINDTLYVNPGGPNGEWYEEPLSLN